MNDERFASLAPVAPGTAVAHGTMRARPIGSSDASARPRVAGRVSSVFDLATASDVPVLLAAAQPLHADAAPAHVTPPDVAPRLPRERLQRLLDRWCRQPLACAMWLGATSGSGKTTLAAAWAARWPAVLWWRLDIGDADPAALTAHLAEALTHARGVPAGSVLPSPTREQLVQPARWLRGQVRALFAALPAQTLLVIDDLQALREPGLRQTLLEALLEEAGAGHRLLFLSHDPLPDTLARHAAAGRIEALDARSLAFDAEDTAAWMTRHGAAGPDDNRSAAAAAQASELHARSAGWPAAVALLMQPQGEHRVQALLGQSLWPTLDAATRTLLEAGAWLPSLSARDIDTNADAERLDELAARSLLVDRLPGTSPRWALHSLLRKFLQGRQRRALARDVLMQRLDEAAQRTEAGGDIDAALALREQTAGLDAVRWREVDALLCRHAAAWLAACRHAGLREAAARVPEAQRSGELLWRQAQAESLRSPGAGRKLADQALQRLPAHATDIRVQCHTLAIASHFQSFDDTRPLAARVAALQGLGVGADQHDGNADQRAAVAVAVWSALFLRQPTHPACPAWLERVRALMHEAVDPNLKLRAAMLLAKQAWYHGTHVEMAQLPLLAQAELTRSGVAPYGRLLWGLMRQYAAWAAADWDAGREATCAALADACGSGIHLLDQHLRLHGACFEALLGDDDAADRLLAEVAERADAARHMEAWHHFTVRGWIALRRGDAAAAEAEARTAIEAAQAMGPAPHAMALALRCHALQALGEAPTLHTARQELRGLAEATDNRLAAWHGWLLDARTAHDAGDSAGAVQRVARALTIARCNGLWAPIGHEPRGLAVLLGLALEHGIEPETAVRIVRAVRLAPPPDAGAAWPWPLRVFTLGRFDIEVEGCPLVMGGKQQKRPLELLQALIALGGTASASRLADLLWPEAEGDRALDNFEAALRRLRHLLGDGDVLALSGGVLRLNRARVWVDLWAAGPPSRAPFLPDQDARWAHDARERRAAHALTSSA